MNVVGLMSGTSSDGVDVALVDIRGGARRLQVKLLAFNIYPYPKSLQKELIRLASGQPMPIARVCHLNYYIAELFSEAVLKLISDTEISLSELKLIGSHGQTVHHLPIPRRSGKWSIRSTLQIGEPSIIAERTGVTTIADFRARDIAAGGEGAPLTPYFHFHLLRCRRKSRAVINIGGISNITYLKAGAEIEETIAFDMGPGNMLIDGLVVVLSEGKKRFDRNGAMAKQGKVDANLLSELLQHPFLRKEPPKSTGREIFGDKMVEDILQKGSTRGLSYNDILATATAFTASAIATNINRFILKRGDVDEVIVGGGGIHNPVLMKALGQLLAPLPVLTFEDIGFDSRAIEAMTFALLAYQTWHGRPTNIPGVSGAHRSVVLGKVIPGRQNDIGQRFS